MSSLPRSRVTAIQVSLGLRMAALDGDRAAIATLLSGLDAPALRLVIGDLLTCFRDCQHTIWPGDDRMRVALSLDAITALAMDGGGQDDAG